MQKENYYEVNEKVYKVTKKYKCKPKRREKSNLCLNHGTTIVLKLQTKELKKKKKKKTKKQRNNTQNNFF